jgi:hypothetical protein
VAIINPDGLFFGERMAKLSDKARLLWPHIFIASNTVGRIEVNYRKLLNRAFSDFKENPFTDEEEYVAIMGEYQEAHLLFCYTANGQIWGQWDTDKDMLPRYPLKADKKTPEPPAGEFQKWKDDYKNSKLSKPYKLKTFTLLPQKSEKACKNASGVGVGVGGGEGVGEGEGKTLSAKPTADPRFKEFVEDLDRYWKHKNPPDVKFVMTKKCGKNLKQLLADRPNVVLDRAIFQRCLNNRARSPDVVHSQEVHRWILNVFDYVNGPLDRFGKPLGGGHGQHSKAQQRTAGNITSIAAGLGLMPSGGGRALPDGDHRADSEDMGSVDGPVLTVPD